MPEMPSPLPPTSLPPSQIHHLLHHHHHSLHPRLLSIEHDTLNFLSFYLTHLQPLPLFANLRAGLWYTPSSFVPSPQTVNFKSADGHYGKWNSSLRRPNIHLLSCLLEQRGAVVVDVTRKGKVFPDSLTKTLPIWCAIINVLAGLVSCVCNKQVDNNPCAICVPLHCHPSISESEVSQIRALLPRMIASWRGCEQVLESVVPALSQAKGADIKPIRCLWTHVGDVLWRGEGVPLDGMAFVPVVCVTASGGWDGWVEGRLAESLVGNMVFPPRVGFEYFQGGGDDEESWSLGMGAADFWRARELVLRDGERGIEEMVRKVGLEHNGGRGDGAGVRVWESGVWVGEGGELIAVKKAAGQFERVYVLGRGKPESGEEDEEWLQKVVWVPLRDRRGKVECKWAFGRALGPCLGDIRRTIVEEGGSAYVCCMGKNGEWAAGLVIAWLAWHCEVVEGEKIVGYCVGGERKMEVGEVGKERVLMSMLHFSATFPQFQISRNTLKQLNRFFSSPNPSSSVIQKIEDGVVP